GTLLTKDKKALIVYPAGRNERDYTIPSRVTSIYGKAFCGCSFLKSIEIHANVTSIAHSAFSYCSSLASIRVSENNPEYCSINGVLFTKDKCELVAYPSGREKNNYSIPVDIVSIGGNAFCGCLALETLVIPNSVTHIGYFSFKDCLSLKAVTIPSSVTNIECNTFENCPKLTLLVPKGSYAEQYAKEYRIRYETF
ncbi:MAG: leucine-rich repeat domain-containing protein, partial [Thermoguttaceae bacterium]